VSELAESRLRQGVLCSHSATQTISTSSWTSLAFNQDQFKQPSGSSIHDTITNNSRLIAPFAGEYHFDAMISWEAVAADVAIQGRIYKNGSTVLWQVADMTINDAGIASIQQLSGTASLVATDYIELQVWHDRGGSLTLDIQVSVRFGMYALGR
jgi:hypothetical protein